MHRDSWKRVLAHGFRGSFPKMISAAAAPKPGSAWRARPSWLGRASGVGSIVFAARRQSCRIARSASANRRRRGPRSHGLIGSHAHGARGVARSAGATIRGARRARSLDRHGRPVNPDARARRACRRLDPSARQGPNPDARPDRRRRLRRSTMLLGIDATP